MNKNNTYDCRGNEEADNVLCMLENNSVLSESFTDSVKKIILVILTNLESNEAWVEDRINKLSNEMDWLSIFSIEFKAIIVGQLLRAYKKQKYLNNK